jgi:hypothetical protein
VWLSSLIVWEQVCDFESPCLASSLPVSGGAVGVKRPPRNIEPSHAQILSETVLHCSTSSKCGKYLQCGGLQRVEATRRRGAPLSFWPLAVEAAPCPV